MHCVLDFGGVKLETKEKFTRRVGIVSLNQKVKGGIGFRDLRFVSGCKTLSALKKEIWVLFQDTSLYG